MQPIKLYNTPIEIAIRCLLNLNFSDNGTDAERLMFFDYLCLNTADVGGPISIHPPIPNRGIQIFGRKELIKKALALLLSKELIDVTANDSGFNYIINQSGKKFLDYFQTQYFNELREKINWTQQYFREMSNSQMREFIDINLEKWGGEFLSDQTRD
ncbi:MULTISPECIES: ABC-three component system middle component 2 [Sphingobacterium]|uniref:ABC-three component system middle component 2 n=1 Tax=Sphingobacterium TaxID=28453 RepID=UPI00257D9C62|nr:MULTISPECIES: ABC-three component system middle component 2 [Sphingobacterium]